MPSRHSQAYSTHPEFPLTMPELFSETSDGRFPSTHRSVVLAANSGNPVERARAFEVLVRAYWKPVYKHVRLHFRESSEDARELTQGFFARAFEKETLSRYDANKALFRTYLKTCLRGFVLDMRRSERRKKRGGDIVQLSLDFDQAEREIESLASGSSNLEDVFDQEWVRSLFATAVDGLRASTSARGREAVFLVFERYVLDDAGERTSYQSLADELGLKVTDVTNYLASARKEFRSILLDELREITTSEEEFRTEASALGVEP